MITRRLMLPAVLVVMATACVDGPSAPTDAPTAAAAHGAPSAPIVVEFAKAFTGDFANGPWEWQGTAEVPGVGTVSLFSSIDLAALRQAGQVLHAPVYWSLSGAGLNMVVETHGIINLATGSVRTNGRVVSGAHRGAAVHQEGQLTGLDAAGSIHVYPATAR